MATCYTNKAGIPFRFDDQFIDKVMQETWGMNGRYVKNGKGTFLHIFLFGPAGPGLVWDHRNLDPLDNRRSNLDRVSPSTNTRNHPRTWKRAR